MLRINYNKNMSTSKEFFIYVTENFKEIHDVSFRPMMREYLMYYKGKLVGGIYDNRILLKPTYSAKELLPNGVMQIPYEGAKEMILLEDDDPQFVKDLFEKMYLELPEPKKKK